jgi:hypothetical protein
LWLNPIARAGPRGHLPERLFEQEVAEREVRRFERLKTISDTLRTMPLYYVTKSRHAVFHRSMARLLAAAKARHPQAALSMQPGGDMMMVAVALLRTLQDWRAIATLDSGLTRLPSLPSSSSP